MKRILFLAIVLLSTNTWGQTITNSKILLYNYSIDVDDIINKASEDPNAKESISFSSPFSKPKKTYYEDKSGKRIEYVESEGGKKLTASIIDTLYYVTNKLFKENFNTELLPINELDGKVKNIYLNYAYPQLPKGFLKMVIKGKTDYPLYSRLTIVIRQAGVAVGVGNSSGEVTVGSTKGEVNIYLDIYDKDGNKIFDDKFSAVGEESLLSRVNYTGDGQVGGGNFEGVRLYICKLFTTAMEGLIQKMPK